MSSTFEQLVREHYQALYRFAVSLSGNSAEACDLTQQAYMTWAEKGHQLRDASKAKSWLFTTLYREHLRRCRRLDRFPQVELTEADAELPALVPDHVRRLEAREVMEALQQVDEVFRVPLSLFYIGDHSYMEIAAILDVPTGTVMSRIARGKQQLRAFLLGLTAQQRTGRARASETKAS
jgi:RNA polymerase sigma-70 factor (ECF subfamily)